MNLKKEDVYVSLKDKSREELIELYNFLKSVGEKLYRDNLSDFIKNSNYWRYLEIHRNQWMGSLNDGMKIGVTIEQLKEIIKPNFKTKLENAKKEVERIEKLIEEDNKQKVGDWCKFWDDDEDEFIISKLSYNANHTAEYKYHSPESHYKNCEKITNAELIKLLENESK